MSIWGKILGGAAGAMIGGPFGALLGAVAGHVVYDKGAGAGQRREARAPEKEIAFTIAVIALGAKLAKADGVVTKDEIAAFREAFRVPADEMNNVGRVFDMARKRAEGFEPYAKQIAGMFRSNPAVLEELLWCLFHIAKADGKVTGDEQQYLRHVAQIFGISDANFNRIHAEMVGPEEGDPYQALGITADIGDDELKKVYRRLVRENHPDMLVAQGMPEEFVAMANEKLAVINAAYDKIEQARGNKPQRLN